MKRDGHRQQDSSAQPIREFLQITMVQDLNIYPLFNLSPILNQPRQKQPYWLPILCRQDSELRQVETLGNHNYLNPVTTLILHLRTVKVLLREAKTPEPWAALSYWPVQCKGQDPSHSEEMA